MTLRHPVGLYGVYRYANVHVCTYMYLRMNSHTHMQRSAVDMGWLRVVGSLKL